MRCLARRAAFSCCAGSTSEAENTADVAISGRAATAGDGPSAVTLADVTLVTLSVIDWTPIKYDSFADDDANCRQKSAGTENSCC